MGVDNKIFLDYGVRAAIVICTFVAFFCFVGLISQIVARNAGDRPAPNDEATGFRAWFTGLEHLLDVQVVTDREIALYLISVSMVSFVVWLLTRNFFFGFLLFIIAVVLPHTLDQYNRQRQREEFESNLAAGLDLLASSIRSGLSLLQAFEEVAERGVPGVRKEFARIVRDYEHGSSIQEALVDARKRLKSKNFDLLAMALSVNREKGGNLVEAVATMSSSLKEVWRLEEKIQVATAEGRKAAKVITVMPIGILVMVMFLQPTMLTAVVSSFAGIGLLIVAGAMYGVGLWWLFRILDVDV